MTTAARNPEPPSSSDVTAALSHRTILVPALPLLAAIALSACSQAVHRDGATGADINAAAAAAQGDIDTYAGNQLAVHSPTPALSPSAVTAEPQDDAAAARSVIARYYALIADGRFADAYRLWDGAGQASGMTAEAFADSFAKYASYRAQIGAPGRIDAGAGQRYVEVPVRIAGRLVDGDRPFALGGSLTLHRVADIDGATAEQRRWRIRDSAIRPRPVQAAAAVTAGYSCAGDTRVSVRFDREADTATLDRDGRPPVVLAGQRPASGIWYRGGGYELRGKGRDAELTGPAGAPVPCKADSD